MVRAVIDADVLFSFILRDTILRAAEHGLCQPLWSAQILDEVARNLVQKGRVKAPAASALMHALTDAFPEAGIEGYEAHMRDLLNHPKDRHVVAVALEAGADLLVSNYLNDYKPLPAGLHAESADDFLCRLFHQSPVGMMQVIESQVSSLRRPSVSTSQLLEFLQMLGATRFVELLEED